MKDSLRCPLCSENINHQFGIKGLEDKVTNWYICRCGFMFHNESHTPEDYFNEEYKSKHADLKKIKDREEYYLRCYAQIIEEKTYGRRFLDVGFTSPFILREMERRGWLTCGIDIIPNEYVTGDFFKEKFEGEKFDCIWMGDFLQATRNPIQAIFKAYRLLNPNGILFISTPNTDLIRRDVTAKWGHWDMTTNYTFINERILKEALIKCSKGFNGRFEILYFDKENESNRFPTWNNMHLIAQKIKIENNPLFDEDINDLKENRVNGSTPQGDKGLST